MEPEEDKTKKLNDDFVEFVRKRSDIEAPRYTTRLRTYVDRKRKRERANAARRHYENGHDKMSKKKTDDELKNKGLENKDNPVGDKEEGVTRSSVMNVARETSEGSLGSLPGRGSSASTGAESDRDALCAEPFLAARLPARPTVRDGNKLIPHGGSSRSRSVEPSDRCGGRRRRRRRRRSSCGRRRRRRRRSGRRRRSCRRRRRSGRRRRSRRRRRRSCRRRRHRACRRRR